MVDAIPGPDQQYLLEGAEHDEVDNAVTRLPSRRRAIAIARWYFGHSVSQVAREFGTTNTRVLKELALARRQLRCDLAWFWAGQPHDPVMSR
jgi:DNA-directed RNA polymerase specialized sigma24 family protein